MIPSGFVGPFVLASPDRGLIVLFRSPERRSRAGRDVRGSSCQGVMGRRYLSLLLGFGLGFKANRGREIDSLLASACACSVPAGTSPTLVLTEPEVYKASSVSGDGERKIHYHIFEMDVTPEDLCEEW
jgi:hypothetical protein